MDMDREEAYREQHSRANWLKVGDQNTTFFQRFASQRRQTNYIHELRRFDGTVAITHDEMVEEAKVYINNLFNSQGIGNVDHILSGVKHSITAEMNCELTTEYKMEMGKTKAASVDGFLAMFY